tara:strand:+ start:171 stop:2006 length:1836 start_codon:yes stop_codon:yes gene_type:complete
MCGICGIINFNKKSVVESSIRTMMEKIKHRGPDDDGIFLQDNIGLGFVRLSILDLSALGHQPMFSEDSRYVIIFNGEIYNYIEIRESLKNKYNFISQTDTEVILAAYIEWGEHCVSKFNGMWSFLIYDNLQQQIFISRDRFGIKPFYYYHDNDTFIFSSEIPPILKIKPNSTEINNKIMFDYLLTNRTNHSQETFFKRINKLQHGHNIQIDLKSGLINFQRWYDLKSIVNTGYKNSNEFKSDLISSVKLRLRSDVPIGLCLSGGIDSSTIGSIISKEIGRQDIHSFSAIYGKGKRGDESEFINEFNGYIDNIHYTVPTIHSLMRDIDPFINALAEPLPGTSEYAEFKVMELAKKYCTVVLNGQGVDEYLAGYHYFVGLYLKQRLWELKWIDMLNETYKFYKNSNSFYHVKSFIYFVLPSWIQKILLFKKHDYISNYFFQQHVKDKDDLIFEKLYKTKTLRESFINHFEYKFEHHLLWADKSGMHSSLETRFPFLDHNIVEKVLNTNIKNIYNNGINKVILRNSMKGLIPEKIRLRKDKIGYETPEDDWFRTKEFSNVFLDVINSASFRERPYFDYNNVVDLFNKHKIREVNSGKELWKILHTELWIRKFIE